MKNTTVISASANTDSNKTPKLVNVGDLIKDSKAKNPDAITDPQPYPQAPEPEANAPEAASTEPAPSPQPEAKAPDVKAPEAPAQTMALVPVRSRSEEIEFQVEKSRQLQLINTQLVSLKTKLAELKQFSFTVDKDDDYRYGRLTIFDDSNREFVCKNHGLAALVVEQLKRLFEQKIEEKESELLTVARS